MSVEAEYFDHVVIGSGPGGQAAATQAASAGKKVALVDRERVLGGACVHQGTIPSKTLREAALTLKALKSRAEYFDFKIPKNLEVESLMSRLDEVLGAHCDFIAEQLNTTGVQLVHGRAKLLEDKVVEVMQVDGSIRHLRAENIIISTGSRPRTPPNAAVDHENILDSDSILRMIYLPRSIIVIGGGVIGSEYASIFSLLGCQVTLIDRPPRPLMFVEEDLTNRFLEHFTLHGGIYRGGVTEDNVYWDGTSQCVVELEGGEKLYADKVLVAKGRLANVERLGLENLGISQGKYGHIEVDECYQTNVPGVYAVGDVIGIPALASCSVEQGRRAANHSIGVESTTRWEHMPMGIYSVPEISFVGLSEADAREKFGDVTVARVPFKRVARAHISGVQDGMLKMVADAAGEKLLGVQIVCDGATDLIHLGELALINGNDIDVFLDNVVNFPTMGEAYRIAATEIKNQRIKKMN